MFYKITITRELEPDELTKGRSTDYLYEQTVDDLDLWDVIKAVNGRPDSRSLHESIGVSREELNTMIQKAVDISELDGRKTHPADDNDLREEIWSCKIGGLVDKPIPPGGDGPMRDAVCRAFFDITGSDHDFIFSGWSAPLTDSERAVVNKQGGGSNE